MIELAVAAALSAAVGVLWGLTALRFKAADPARAAARELGGQIAEHTAPRSFLRARLDPEKTTGLALSLALVALAVLFVVFGVAIAMIRSNTGMVRVDLAVTSWAAAHATPFSEAAFTVITQAGSTAGVIVLGLAVAAYAYRRRRRWDAALFLLAVLAGQLLLSNVVKVAVERVRPDAPPFHVFSGPSFPSGHATAAAAAWAAVVLVLGSGATSRTRAVLAGAAAGIAVMVACSRVFLGAHWTSDVIGGLLLGWTWFALCAVAFGGRVLRLGAPARDAKARGEASPAAAQAPGEGAEQTAARAGRDGAAR